MSDSSTVQGTSVDFSPYLNVARKIGGGIVMLILTFIGLTAITFIIGRIMPNDPVVATSSYDAATSTFSVPARTTAVFTARRSMKQRIELLIGDVEGLVAVGVLSTDRGGALRAKLESVLARLAAGQHEGIGRELDGFSRRVEALATAGVLSAEQAEGLIGEPSGVFAQPAD